MNNRFELKSRDCKSALFSWRHYDKIAKAPTTTRVHSSGVLSADWSSANWFVSETSSTPYTSIVS